MSLTARRSRAIAVCAFFAAAAIAQAAADEPAPFRPPPFRLCADPDNLPFSGAGATPGFTIELGEAVAQALNRPFQPVWVPTYYVKRQIRLKLLAGQCDAIAGVPDDPSFDGPRLVSSKPIAHLGYALVSPAANSANTLQDLHGRRVAVQFASPPQNLLAAWNDTPMVTAASPEQAMQDLAAGKADAAFIWGPSAGWLNSTEYHDAYRVVTVNADNMAWDAAIAFPRNQADLRDRVNRALDSLAPTIQALAAKYHFPTAQAAQPQPAADTQPAVPAAQTGANPNEVVAGRKIFNETCAHCHGPDAIQGEQRRNLRLLSRRYGDQMPEMFMATVTHGRPSKGMPNWSGILTEDEFHKILAFLKSVQDPGS